MPFSLRATGLVAGCLLVGCVGGPNDRCYIDELRYHEARRAFERTGSIEVVRQALADEHWPNCMANEAIYRIEKEFGLNDALPSPVRVRGEQELRAEEQSDGAQTSATFSAPGFGSSGAGY